MIKLNGLTSVTSVTETKFFRGLDSILFSFRRSLLCLPNIFDKNTLNPVNIDINKVDIRCSLIPMNTGFSPGAVFSDISFKEFICDKASTVAATNHGLI